MNKVDYKYMADIARRIENGTEFTAEESLKFLSYEMGIPLELLEARMAVLADVDLLECPEDL